MYHMTQSKKGISSIELGRLLGVKQDTAWKVKHKLKQVMLERDAAKKLSGRIEIDDAYVGGERRGGKRGRGAAGKTPFFADHEIGRELKAMSQWLDEHREIIGLVAEDLRRHDVKETGRQGLPAESVLRCGLLKQHRQLSYEELAFHLEDSASFHAFARLPLSWTPKKSVLQKTTSAIRAETWEAINRILLASARQAKVETGKVVRLDSTVTAALLHEPSDSSLLWDAVRVMVRLLRVADTLIGDRLVWRDHRRAIEYARVRPNRVPHCRELIKLTRATLAYAD